MDFPQFAALPKAELHVHLEGSMRPELVAELAAARFDHPFSGLGAQALRERFQTASFQAFLENFIAGYRLLDRAEHFQRVSEDLMADFQEQGICKAQVLYSPGVYTQKLGIPLGEIHKGIAAGLAQFPGIEVCFILDTVLNLGFTFMETTLSSVLAERPDFVRGFSVGGGDPKLDMTEFVPLFHKAADAGLFCVAHAGEVDGPNNIDTLLRETDVCRIAHGCRAVESEETLTALKRRGVVIDVCLTSNIYTGTVSGLETHPLPIFREKGIPVTLNTDDPLYFQTDLYGEYQAAGTLPGIDDEALRQIAAQSLAAFKF